MGMYSGCRRMLLSPVVMDIEQLETDQFRPLRRRSYGVFGREVERPATDALIG